MDLVRLIAWLLYAVLLVYTFFLFARLVLDWIPFFNREWRPKGALLVVAELVYTVTDPPLRFLRRFIPPLRVGGVSIDFGFAIVLFVCFILLSVTRSLAT